MNDAILVGDFMTDYRGFACCGLVYGAHFAGGCSGRVPTRATRPPLDACVEHGITANKAL